MYIYVYIYIYIYICICMASGLEHACAFMASVSMSCSISSSLFIPTQVVDRCKFISHNLLIEWF